MKLKNIIIALVITVGLSGCEQYLDQAPESILSEKDVFQDYNTFQAFTDKAMLTLTDPLYAQTGNGLLFPDGDNTHSGSPSTLQYWATVGDYRMFMTGIQTSNQLSTIFYCALSGYTGTLLWGGSWYSIRNSNIALSNISMLENAKTATAEQVNLVKGSNLFLRGFCHYQLMSLWGGLPYIDVLLQPNDELRIPRPTLKDGMQKSVNDLVAAAEWLPKNWDETEVGKANLGQNQGRPTQGAAYGMAARVLLFMGSPLNNPNYQYDTELCKKSAMYGWEVIQLAQAGYHDLMPIGDPSSKTNDGTLQSCFAIKKTGQSFYNKENLFIKIKSALPSFSSDFWTGLMGATKTIIAPTQNLVDKFQTKNGWLPEDDPSYNPLKPWENRDPRFYMSIATDNTRMGVGNATNDFYTLRTFADDGTGKPGREYGVGQTETGYWIRKYWMYDNVPGGENDYNSKSTVATPLLRLAEVYLNYAEALMAAGFTPDQKPTFSNGKQGISALDAVNVLRGRKVAATGLPILPPLDAARMAKYGAPGKDGTVKGSFMEYIWNERAVELCFEMSRWNDLRRWHVAHLPQYCELRGCRFNKSYTNFSYPILSNIFFQDRNYWLPIPTQQLNIFEGYNQNPGW